MIQTSYATQYGLLEGQWVKSKISKVDLESSYPDIEKMLVSRINITSGIYDEEVEWHMVTVEQVSDTSAVFVKTDRLFGVEEKSEPYTVNLVKYSDLPEAIPIDSKIGDTFETEDNLIGTLRVNQITTANIAGQNIRVFELTSSDEQTTLKGVYVKTEFRALYDAATGILFDNSMSILAIKGEETLFDFKVYSTVIDFFVPEQKEDKITSQLEGGGCLIATATYGTELAPQVQQLRELRDNVLLQTNSGSAFMTGFNQFYYSVSPTIADWERQNTIFRETVKISITPLITSLTLLEYVDIKSELDMLGYGISLILLNIGLYVGAPVFLILKAREKLL